LTTSISAWKGQEVVVRALIDVVKRYRDIVCLFVGDATPGDIPYKQRLESLVAEHGLEKNVRFTGFQKTPADYLNLMSIVLHASVDPEPYGMVVLEAMALKKPVIASRAGGPTEVVVDGKTGFTYPPGDAAGLATRLVSLLDNPAEAAAMGQRGYQRLVADFSQDGYMRLIQDAYARALAEASGTRGVSRRTQPA
jgi:glycosyltransferase involved in cell wall biosynthesis